MEKEILNFNQAQQQICDMNMEITLFLDKFTKFRNTFNVINKQLLQNLENIYKEIEDFIDNDPQDIKANNSNFNINLNEHYINRIFICNSCNMDIGDRSRDITKHIQFYVKHKINLQKTRQLTTAIEDKDKSKKCNEGKQILKEEIIKARKEKAELKKKRQLEESRKLPKKAKIFLTSDFRKFFQDSIMTSDKMKTLTAYEEIGKNIINTIKSTYPDAKVHFFGSRISGLGGMDSDLDIFLEIGNVENDNQADISKKLNKVTKLLRKTKDWNNFAPIAAARVPILRAFNIKEGIDCDIGFSNALGERNTMLMKYFFELQPICHKMCLFLKKWLLVTTLKSKFSTYTLVLMVIYYLQIEKLLPSVKSLQKDIEKPIELGPWQGDFIKKDLKELKIDKLSSSNLNCITYLKNFFLFYTCTFDYKTSIICPYLGVSVLRISFNNDMLNEMPRYSKLYKADRANGLQLETPLCVQDPLELNHNVAKGISDGVLQLLKHYFIASNAELLNCKVN